MKTSLNRFTHLTAFLSALVVCACASGFTRPASETDSSGPNPATIMARGEWLAETRARIKSRDPLVAAAFRSLMKDADEALVARPLSVTQKKVTPPSGDKHDFLSLAPYWWPDSTKQGGLPYIRRDGDINPQTRTDHDGLRLQATIDAVEALSLANYFTGERKYSARAAHLLRAWFLDSATRMNPNLRFAQAVLGVNEGRGIGIIDTRHLPQLVDAESLLRTSGDWSESDHAALVSWCRAYLTWMVQSTNGKEERAAENNHGTWMAAQLVALALFVNDTSLAREVLAETRTRIGKQIKPDGSQPLELERTRPVHYSVFNLDAYTQLAEMGRHTGDDLWHFVSPGGGSLHKALIYATQFTDSSRKPATPELVPLSPEDFAAPIRRAVMYFPDSALVNGLRRLRRESTATARGFLLYPYTRGQPQLDSSLTSALALASTRLAQSSMTLDPAKGYPRYVDSTGQWVVQGATQWTSGFFAGTLWYMYQLTGDSLWQSRAAQWTAGLERVKDIRRTHDLGFMVFDSFGHGAILTGSAAYKGIVLQASRSLATRYNPRIQAIKSWDIAATDSARRGWDYPVIIDNLMNLEMLFWAAASGGDSAWKNVAEAHALTSSRAHMRNDGSTFHVVLFDTTTGKKVRGLTWQGLSDSSTWSRGQAWAIHGFTGSYRRTRNPLLLASATQVADFFISHLPADGVPYWDFNSPDIPNTPRDASAAAIAASGLFDLARWVDSSSSRRYRTAAEKILLSLARDYTTANNGSAAILQHSTGAFPHKSEVDVGIVYADYFFIEAILRQRGMFLE